MTPEQKKSFLDRGFLYLSGALAKGAVQPVRTHILNELKRLNIWSTGRTLSQKFEGVPIFQQTGKLGQLISYPNLSERIISKDLYLFMCRLADTPLSGQDAQLLISLPHKVDWTLNGLNWHRDISKSQLRGLPGVQAFVLFDNVAEKGGATLIVAGSHQLENQSQIKNAVSEISGGSANRSFKVNDVELQIIEMAGQAGDIYLMDMRVLHTPSVNASGEVRMMATARYLAAR